MDWTTVFTCVMTSITTFAVAFLGLYQTRKSKEAEDYRKLREELETERQQKLELEKEEEENRLRALEESVNSMKSDVRTLKEDMQLLTNTNLLAIKDQLSHLHTLQAGSLSYMTSLSNVVVMIGEALDDSESINDADRKKITSSIEKHRELESKIHGELYNIIA